MTAPVPVELPDGQEERFYEPCPNGCGCVTEYDPDSRDCGCDGPCTMAEDWPRLRESVTLDLPEQPTMACPCQCHTYTTWRWLPCSECDDGRVPIPPGTAVVFVKAAGHISSEGPVPIGVEGVLVESREKVKAFDIPELAALPDVVWRCTFDQLRETT